MNILQITHEHNQGGIENFVLNHYHAIDRGKYNFVFLTFYTPGPYDLDTEFAKYGAHSYFVPSSTVNPSTYRPKNWKAIAQILKKEKIDLVHVHPYVFCETIPTIAKLHGIPIISHGHMSKITGSKTFPKKLIKKPLIRCLTAYSNLIATRRLACSPEAGRFSFRRRPYDLLVNGIDIPKFQFSPAIRTSLRKKYGIKDHETVLIHIGRFVRDKNQTFLLDIFKDFQQIRPCSKLILIGDGSQLPEMKQKAHALGLAGSVIFLGSRNDAHLLLNMADLFVLPSLSEGLGIVLIEAQANGLKCLASDAVPREADQTGSVEFLSLQSPARVWAEKLATLDPSRRPENYQKLLNSDYNIDNSVKKLESIYDAVYASKRKNQHDKK